MTKDDAVKWLTAFMEKVVRQDNRMTATPFFYTIKNGKGKTHNVFFTEEAATQYLKNNKHNYPEAYVYLDHAHRNTELLTLLIALGVLVDVPYVGK